MNFIYCIERANNITNRNTFYTQIHTHPIMKKDYIFKALFSQVFFIQHSKSNHLYNAL